MTIPAPLRSRAAAFPALLAMLLPAGCCGLNATAPQDAREALARVNSNLNAISGPLQARATASFRFRDTQGEERRFLFHPSAIVFEAPRCMIFEIRSSLGPTVANIGSNSDRYWLWVDVSDLRKLWSGTWEALENGNARPLVVPPDDLLDILMMRPMPIERPANLKPLLAERDGRHLLVYQGVDADGWPFVEREVHLDACPPYLPTAIYDYSADGTELMRALFADYRPIDNAGPDAPLVPRSYKVYWDQEDAELLLDLSEVRYRETEPPCEFPSRWRGDYEELDERPLRMET